MPKDRRKRFVAHEPSVKPIKRNFAVQDNAVEHVAVGSQIEASGDDILQGLDNDSVDAPTSLKKKEKRQLKHELFLERLEATRAPYSKSHARRLKRKEKEQLAGGLGGLKSALSSLGKDAPSSGSADDPVNSAKSDDSSPSTPAVRTSAGSIGEGNGAPLRQGRRKQALKVEQFRMPKILANPEFAANPFETIRTHAKNTLIQHHPPSAG